MLFTGLQISVSAELHEGDGWTFDDVTGKLTVTARIAAFAPCLKTIYKTSKNIFADPLTIYGSALL